MATSKSGFHAETGVFDELRKQRKEYERISDNIDAIVKNLKDLGDSGRENFISRLVAKIDANKSTLDEAIAVVDKTYHTCNTVETMENTLSTQRENFNSQVGDLNEKIKTLEENSSSEELKKNSRIVELELQLGALPAKVTRIAELEKQVGALQGNLSSLESKNTEISRLEGQVETLQQEASSLQSRKDDAVSEKDEALANVTKLQGEVQAAETAVKQSQNSQNRLSNDLKKATDERDQAVKAAQDERDRVVKAAQIERDQAVKAAQDERDQAVKAAQDERDQAVKTAQDQRDSAVQAARDQKDSAVKAVHRQRNQAVKAAQDQRDGVVRERDAVQSTLDNVIIERDQVIGARDTATGHVQRLRKDRNTANETAAKFEREKNTAQSKFDATVKLIRSLNDALKSAELQTAKAIGRTKAAVDQHAGAVLDLEELYQEIDVAYLVREQAICAEKSKQAILVSRAEEWDAERETLTTRIGKLEEGKESLIKKHEVELRQRNDKVFALMAQLRNRTKLLFDNYRDYETEVERNSELTDQLKILDVEHRQLNSHWDLLVERHLTLEDTHKEHKQVFRRVADSGEAAKRKLEESTEKIQQLEFEYGAELFELEEKFEERLSVSNKMLETLQERHTHCFVSFAGVKDQVKDLKEKHSNAIAEFEAERQSMVSGMAKLVADFDRLKVIGETAAGDEEPSQNVQGTKATSGGPTNITEVTEGQRPVSPIVDRKRGLESGTSSSAKKPRSDAGQVSQDTDVESPVVDSQSTAVEADIELQDAAEEVVAVSIVDSIKDNFLLAWDATPDERANFLSQLQRVVGKQTISKFTESLDLYCRGPVAKLVFPGPCFFEKIANHAAGSGGDGMTQSSCKACKSNKRTCLFVKLAPTVATGFGPRDSSGKIQGAIKYDSTVGPRTVALQGADIRWIVKKRKMNRDDPSDPIWTQGTLQV